MSDQSRQKIWKIWPKLLAVVILFGMLFVLLFWISPPPELKEALKVFRP